ncbi:hypothetical protein BCR34DRAFT_292373 [Clohesyomyces aquaticus]|uniref:Cora-like Mg2+ transporter protein-domain-containing protein n=1 Tax=Clohesyomyces aquaticus TaxID=1231657 RepID=A0A1Y2A8A0_9PLEO|nr:hypothetical protein BCR34DRAFT_292373 [Clohesyomyces aquaticus]
MLELFLLTLNQGEFIADAGRYQARDNGGDIGPSIFAHDHKSWRKKTERLYRAIYCLNIFRRRLAYFEDDLQLNLERLGCGPSGSPWRESTPSKKMPSAIEDANMDLSAALARLKLYKSRADALTSQADEIVNLRAADKSLEDGAFNLRLAVLAAIVFPATLIAALLGMSDGFKPGDGQFWVFWVVSIPAVLIMVFFVLRPDSSRNRIHSSDLSRKDTPG